MSYVQRFLAVLICRGQTITNFDGVFEQSPIAPFAKTRWLRVDFKAIGRREHRQSGWLRLR